MIDLSTFYKFIYVSVSFHDNINFVKTLKETYGVEIPYLDLDTLNPELQDSLDSYIYLKDDESFVKTYKKLCSKYPRISFTVLGRIRGKNIYKFFDICKEENTQTFKPGDKIRLVSGEFKGLIADIREIQGVRAVIEYPILKEKKTRTVPLSEIGSFEDSFDLFADQFKDIEAQYKSKGMSRHLIIDGNDALHRCIQNNNNKYNGKKQYVGGFYGFYFTLLKLKEFYPEYTLHVVFEDFEESPEYTQKSQIYRDAFLLNFRWAVQFSNAVGFHTHYFKNHPSKNVIYSLCKGLEKEKTVTDIFIYTTNPLLQTLVSEKTTIFYPKVTFRGNAEYYNKEQILKNWEVDSLEKITWVLAIEGFNGTVSANAFFLAKSDNQRQIAQKARKTEYFPLIQNAKNVEEFKIALSENVKYKEYLQSNVFDAVLQALAFPEVLLACNLDKKERDEEAALKILEETQFYKEIEYWDRSYRMLRGLW